MNVTEINKMALSMRHISDHIILGNKNDDIPARKFAKMAPNIDILRKNLPVQSINVAVSG